MRVRLSFPPAEPSPSGGSAGGFPFLADTGVQTGASLQFAEAAAAAAAGAADELVHGDDYDGGYGGDFGGMDDYEQPDAGGLGGCAAAGTMRLFGPTAQCSMQAGQSALCG